MHISPDWLVIVANRQSVTFLQNQGAGAVVKLGNLHVMTRSTMKPPINWI